MPPLEACRVLIECLFTLGGSAQLMHHSEAYVELVLRLSPDLSGWFRWFDQLGPEATEDTVAYASHLLAELAAKGHEEANSVLRAYLLHGRHWEATLAALGSDMQLDVHTWLQLVPRLDDETLALHMGKGAHPWPEVALGDERVARLLQDKLRRQADHAERTSWSAANYAAAELSQRRWRVLKNLIACDPDTAAALLVDGLWDGSLWYRTKCIELCDLEQPGARDRITRLAAMDGFTCAKAARQRLQGLPPMDA